MPIETKDIIEYLGFNPENVKELEDLKSNFEKEFIRASAITEDYEPVKKIVGKIYGSIETDLTKVAKSHEINLDEISDWKDSKIKDKLKIVTSKLSEKQQSMIDELQKKASQNNDEKVNELSKMLEKKDKKLNDTESLLKSISKEYDEFKNNSSNQLKTIKLDTMKTNLFTQIKFKDGINEIEQEGYNSIIGKKFRFDLDENGKMIVTDSDGKLIPNSKVTGTFKSPDEVLTEEAVKLGLYKLNNDGGKQKPTPTKTASPMGEVKALRQVAQRMII
jgi:hypothetical protein